MALAKDGLWITAQKERDSKLREHRNTLIVRLAKEGFSYGDIAKIVRIDRGGAYRIVNSKPVL